MQFNKKLILLDLDNTLFDSSSYRKSIFTKIGNISLCQEIYDKMIRESGYFFPKDFAEIISKQLREENEKKVLSIIFDPKNFRDNLHKEVLSSLKKLTMIGEVGILSQGDKEFQNAKIIHFKHFLSSDHIHILADKKSDMMNILKNLKDYKLYFVDDMPSMLRLAKKIDPSIVAIWIRRGRYAENQKDIPEFKPDAEVGDLSEVVGVIQRN